MLTFVVPLLFRWFTPQNRAEKEISFSGFVLLRVKRISRLSQSTHKSKCVDFSVQKGERDGRTFTRVERLDRDERKEELARLMGGGSISETLRQSAAELLDQAAVYLNQ